MRRHGEGAARSRSVGVKVAPARKIGNMRAMKIWLLVAVLTGCGYTTKDDGLSGTVGAGGSAGAQAGSGGRRWTGRAWRTRGAAGAAHRRPVLAAWRGPVGCRRSGWRRRHRGSDAGAVGLPGMAVELVRRCATRPRATLDVWRLPAAVLVYQRQDSRLVFKDTPGQLDVTFCGDTPCGVEFRIPVLVPSARTPSNRRVTSISFRTPLGCLVA